MQDIVEIQITKYKKGTHPHDDGEVLCSYIISGSEEDKKLKALRRLLEYVKSKDDNLLTFKRSQTYQLLKFKTDGVFNEKGEIVFSKEIKGNKEFHSKALRRLANILSRKNGENYYVAYVPLVEHGENCYIMSTRATKKLNEKDKLKQWKKQISAKKAAITRNKNKAKNIREEYKTTLFPNAYKDNKRFKSLVKYLYAQKSRLHGFIGIGLKNIETIVGGYNPSSVFKV